MGAKRKQQGVNSLSRDSDEHFKSLSDYEEDYLAQLGPVEEPQVNY